MREKVRNARPRSLQPAAIFTLLTFTCSNLLYAAVPPTTVNIPAANSSSEVRIPLLAEKIEIPEILGTVKERFIPQGSVGAVIHVEDAHASHDAQNNIEKILNYLQENYQIGLVQIEGAVDEVDGDLLRPFEESWANRELADLLAKDGYLNGADLFLLADAERAAQSKSGKIAAYGVEALDLYKKNVQAFYQVYSQENQIQDFLTKVKDRISTESSKVFNPELKRFAREWLFYQDIPSEFMRHIKTLKKYAFSELKIDFLKTETQISWPMLARFYKIENTKIDSARAAEEHQKLVKWLAEQKIQGEVSAVVKDYTAGKGFPKNRFAGTRSLLEHFYDEVSAKGFAYRKYPELSKEWGTLVLREELDASGLFREVEILTAQIIERLAKDPKEKEIIGLYQDFQLIKKALKLGLSPDDYTAAQGRQDLMRPSAFAVRSGFDKKQNGFSVLDPVFEKALEFYALAKKRDAVITGKTIARMKSEKQLNSVLVAGGFHSAGIAEELKKQNVAYVSITPRMNQLEEDKSYAKLMMLAGNDKTENSEVGLAHTADNPVMRRAFPALAGSQERRKSEISKTLIAKDAHSFSMRAEVRQRRIGTYEKLEGRRVMSGEDVSGGVRYAVSQNFVGTDLTIYDTDNQPHRYQFPVNTVDSAQAFKTPDGKTYLVLDKSVNDTGGANVQVISDFFNWTPDQGPTIRIPGDVHVAETHILEDGLTLRTTMADQSGSHIYTIHGNQVTAGTLDLFEKIDATSTGELTPVPWAAFSTKLATFRVAPRSAQGQETKIVENGKTTATYLIQGFDQGFIILSGDNNQFLAPRKFSGVDSVTLKVNAQKQSGAFGKINLRFGVIDYQTVQKAENGKPAFVNLVEDSVLAEVEPGTSYVTIPMSAFSQLNLENDPVYGIAIISATDESLRVGVETAVNRPNFLNFGTFVRKGELTELSGNLSGFDPSRHQLSIYEDETFWSGHSNDVVLRAANVTVDSNGHFELDAQLGTHPFNNLIFRITDREFGSMVSRNVKVDSFTALAGEVSPVTDDPGFNLINVLDAKRDSLLYDINHVTTGSPAYDKQTRNAAGDTILMPGFDRGFTYKAPLTAQDIADRGGYLRIAVDVTGTQITEAIVQLEGSKNLRYKIRGLDQTPGTYQEFAIPLTGLTSLRNVVIQQSQTYQGPAPVISIATRPGLGAYEYLAVSPNLNVRNLTGLPNDDKGNAPFFQIITSSGVSAEGTRTGRGIHVDYQIQKPGEWVALSYVYDSPSDWDSKREIISGFLASQPDVTKVVLEVKDADGHEAKISYEGVKPAEEVALLLDRIVAINAGRVQTSAIDWKRIKAFSAVAYVSSNGSLDFNTLPAAADHVVLPTTEFFNSDINILDGRTLLSHQAQEEIFVVNIGSDRTTKERGDTILVTNQGGFSYRTPISQARLREMGHYIFTLDAGQASASQIILELTDSEWNKKSVVLSGIDHTVGPQLYAIPTADISLKDLRQVVLLPVVSGDKGTYEIGLRPEGVEIPDFSVFYSEAITGLPPAEDGRKIFWKAIASDPIKMNIQFRETALGQTVTYTGLPTAGWLAFGADYDNGSTTAPGIQTSDWSNYGTVNFGIVPPVPDIRIEITDDKGNRVLTQFDDLIVGRETVVPVNTEKLRQAAQVQTATGEIDLKHIKSVFFLVENWNNITPPVLPPADGTLTITTVSTRAPEDTNLDGFVTPIDALLVINWLNNPIEGFVPQLDVTRDGHIVPIDALRIINKLNRGQGEGETMENPALDALYPFATLAAAEPRYDVNGDGSISPIDALIVINAINNISNLYNVSNLPNPRFGVSSTYANHYQSQYLVDRLSGKVSYVATSSFDERSNTYSIADVAGDALIVKVSTPIFSAYDEREPDSVFIVPVSNPKIGGDNMIALDGKLLTYEMDRGNLKISVTRKNGVIEQHTVNISAYPDLPRSLDLNDDGALSPIDALLIINRLNAPAAEAEYKKSVDAVMDEETDFLAMTRNEIRQSVSKITETSFEAVAATSSAAQYILPIVLRPELTAAILEAARGSRQGRANRVKTAFRNALNGMPVFGNGVRQTIHLVLPLNPKEADPVELATLSLLLETEEDTIQLILPETEQGEASKLESAIHDNMKKMGQADSISQITIVGSGTEPKALIQMIQKISGRTEDARGVVSSNSPMLNELPAVQSMRRLLSPDSLSQTVAAATIAAAYLRESTVKGIVNFELENLESWMQEKGIEAEGLKSKIREAVAAALVATQA